MFNSTANRDKQPVKPGNSSQEDGKLLNSPAKKPEKKS